MTDMKVEKRGMSIPISEQFALYNSGFERKGHWEEIPLTDEDRELHARAVAAYKEVNSNPWIDLSGYEYEFEVRPLEPKRIFMPEETDEEHLARWIAAGRPQHNFFQDSMRLRVMAMLGANILPADSAFVKNGVAA